MPTPRLRRPVHRRAPCPRRARRPGPVVTEACYLLAREAGARAEAASLDSLADGDLAVIDLERRDRRRAAQLVVQYADFPLGAVDAAPGSPSRPRSFAE
jgi:uncharacterized protein